MIKYIFAKPAILSTYAARRWLHVICAPPLRISSAPVSSSRCSRALNAQYIVIASAVINIAISLGSDCFLNSRHKIIYHAALKHATQIFRFLYYFNNAFISIVNGALMSSSVKIIFLKIPSHFNGEARAQEDMLSLIFDII